MLNLPQVTLCCVDTRLPHMALEAMKHSMSKAHFGHAILFTCPDHNLKDLPSDITVVAVPHINTIEAYSHVLLKEMGPHVQTSHQLIIQWDGYVIDPTMWRDDYLAVDYIGAVWPQFHDAHRVGNGGFSLRSKKLLNALTSPDISPQHPEDVCIARTYRTLLEQRWDIRFADEAMAHDFAFERDRETRSSFGFHGLSNMALLLSEAELNALVAHAPQSLFASVEARGFIKHLIRRNMKPLAREALSKRRHTRELDIADCRLWARLIL
jgi:hypothetical protein